MNISVVEKEYTNYLKFRYSKKSPLEMGYYSIIDEVDPDIKNIFLWKNDPNSAWEAYYYNEDTTEFTTIKVVSGQFEHHRDVIIAMGYIISDAIADNLIKELPCNQCHKMNDVGVKKCWWCETTLIKG